MLSQKHSLRVCKTKGRDSVKSQTDRLNELPDDILSSIVSYFSLRDAAKASLLSSRWRHHCSSMSRLDFTWKSMFRTHLDSDSGSDCESDDFAKHPCKEFKDRFVQGVNQFLQYYKGGSRLVFFKVGFCLESDSISDIDQWVRFAVSRGVEELYLALSCGRCMDHTSYILRSELLSNPNNLFNLRILCLSSCILGPGVIDHFGSIKELILVNVSVGQEEIESIYSCCLNLESFTLASSKVPPKLFISSSFQRLKFLVVNLCRGLEEIELSATTLTSFEYTGLLIKYYFSTTPNLKKVFFKARGEEGEQYVLSQLAKDLPFVETVSICTETNWVKRQPKEMATFNNVKQLELFLHQTMKLDILSLIICLRAFPLLEKLYLAVKCRVHFEQRMQFLTSEQRTQVLHKFVNTHLKQVHIGGFYYSTSFIKFALYLLKYAARLEKMVIDPQPSFYIGFGGWCCYNFPWGEEEHQKVCEQLQGRFKCEVIVMR